MPVPVVVPAADIVVVVAVDAYRQAEASARIHKISQKESPQKVYHSSIVCVSTCDYKLVESKLGVRSAHLISRC